MPKRAFLIHGWEGYPEEGWKPWLKNELQKRGFEVFVPAMPETKNPRMDAWIPHLAKLVGTPDKDCYFVGHSLGCITILRYLETLEEGQEIGGSVLVADWEKINSRCKRFVAIHSDNDPYVPLRHADIFKEKLNAGVIILHNMKHFSGDDGINELPEALNAVLKISQ